MPVELQYMGVVLAAVIKLPRVDTFIPFPLLKDSVPKRVLPPHEAYHPVHVPIPILFPPIAFAKAMCPNPILKLDDTLVQAPALAPIIILYAPWTKHRAAHIPIATL